MPDPQPQGLISAGQEVNALLPAPHFWDLIQLGRGFNQGGARAWWVKGGADWLNLGASAGKVAWRGRGWDGLKQRRIFPQAWPGTTVDTWVASVVTLFHPNSAAPYLLS